jgi:hypothetical protein
MIAPASTHVWLQGIVSERIFDSYVAPPPGLHGSGFLSAVCLLPFPRNGPDSRVIVGLNPCSIAVNASSTMSCLL